MSLFSYPAMILPSLTIPQLGSEYNLNEKQSVLDQPKPSASIQGLTS